MILNLTVTAENPTEEAAWVKSLKHVLTGVPDVEVKARSGAADPGQVAFIDGALSNLDEVLKGIDRKGRAIFLLVEEGDPVPRALLEGRVDDVLVSPFRLLEVLSKLNHYRNILMWDEVSQLNASFTQLIDGLREDLQLAERLQKSRLPVRFPDVKGMKIVSRYLAGVRAGGDYFDIAESKGGDQLSFVLSDSSSYGLSSSVLSVLMKVALKLTAEEMRSTIDTVKRIYQELGVTLKETDRLSLFYGVLSRKDLKLRYLNLGTSSGFYSPAGEKFRELPAQGGPIVRQVGFHSTLAAIKEGEITLQPDDRLALISDGFVEAVGGGAKMCELLDGFRKGQAVDSLNELAYRIKTKFKDSDDMPDQDCSAMIFDIDSRVIRLAPKA